MRKFFQFILASVCVFTILSFHDSERVTIESEEAPDGYKRTTTITCEGKYPQHLQGIVVGGKNIFWSFTTDLLKTDLKGKLETKVKVPYHHGDLTYHDGMIYVAAGFGKWNNIQGLADSWVYVYDAKDLKQIARHRIPQLVYGAGGLVYHKDRFWVVGGLPNEVNENYIYEYDTSFTFIKRHTIQTGHTHLGIQTIEYHDGQFWLGCYGDSKLIKLNDKLEVVGRDAFDPSLGMASRSKKEIWIGTNTGNSKEGYVGEAIVYKK